MARHSGLDVAQSFRFQASAYPGYKHARTIGVLRGGGGRKGEERVSRSFVFVRRGEGVVMGDGKGKKGKEESSDDDDDESEEGICDVVGNEKDSEQRLEEEEEFEDVDDGRGKHDDVDKVEKESESYDGSVSDEGDEFKGFDDDEDQDAG